MSEYNSTFTGEQIDAAVSKSHEHSNKTILDNVTAAYTVAEQSKLAGIAAGAEVNVQSDWNQSNSAAKDFIKNKPTITAQVQSDWSQSNSGNLAFIQNKPTIPTQTSQLTNNSNFVVSTDVLNIVKLTQVAYDAIGTKSPTTLYLIEE